ncbi:MAG: phosphatidate cytidylyltransferase [Longimicrobiales bacterium]
MAGELAKRVAVAMVGIPLLLVVIYLGGWFLASLLAAVAALGTLEFYRLVRSSDVQPFDLPGAAGSALLVLTATTGTPVVGGSRMWNTAVLLMIVFLVLAVWKRAPNRRPLAATATTMAGALFVGGSLAYAVWLREIPGITQGPLSPKDFSTAWRGTALVAFPLVIIWLSDSFAYFTGRAFGRRKLLPRVSPGKTVEGAVAGLLAGTAVAILLGRSILGPQVGVAASPLLWACGGVTIAAFGQLGDLAESLLKREAGVKDSGTLLPGHGGVLDRFDALFFAFPVSYWFLRWVGLQ